MPIKSILEIEVDDKEFKRYREEFDKYSEAVNKLGVSQKDVFSTKLLESQLSALTDIKELLEQISEGSDVLERKSAQQEKHWNHMAGSARSFALSIFSSTTSLMRWASLSSVFTGLAGLGSIYGMERMAQSVASSRTARLRLGLAPGEQQAVETSYERLGQGVAPNVLERVSDALSDISKRYMLTTGPAALSEQQIEGQGPAEVFRSYIENLKQLADRTDPDKLGLVASSMPQLREMGIDVGTLRALKSMSAEEVNQMTARSRSTVGRFGVDEQAQLRMQDAVTKLETAGHSFSTAVIKSLDTAGLTGALGRFSTALDAMAGKLQTNDFQNRLDRYVSGFVGIFEDIYDSFGAWGKAIKWLLDKLDIFGIGQDIKKLSAFNEEKEKYYKEEGNAKTLAFLGRMFPHAVAGFTKEDGSVPNAAEPIPPGVAADPRPVGRGSMPINNPGNLRPKGDPNHFLQFATPEEGVKAMAAQLQRYQDDPRWGNLSTISDIVSTYAPRSENQTEEYIRNVAARTGKSAGEPLDLHDKQVLAQLIAAMLKQENSKSKYTPKMVLEILNNTGANAQVTAAQVAQ